MAAFRRSRTEVGAAALVVAVGVAAPGVAWGQDEAPVAPAAAAPPVASVAPVAAPSDGASAEVLARLRKVEDELDALRREKAARAPGGGAVTPTLAGISISLGGLVQTDAVLVRQSSQEEINPATGEPLNEKRFILRRARVSMHAEKGFLSGLVTLDGNTVRAPTFRILEGWLAAQWASPDPLAADRAANAPAPVPYATAQVGLMRIPFGIEVLEPDRARSFMERSTAARAMFGNAFDLGARLSGGYRFLRYSVAAMNGAPLGESQFQGRDPNENRDLLAHLGVATEVLPALRFEAGVSGVTGKGFHAGTQPTKDVLTWRDDNENGIVETTEIRVTTGAPATPSSSFRRFLVGADVRVTYAVPRLGDLVVAGQIYRGKNMDRALVVSDPVALGRDLRQSGYVVAVTQRLSPYALVGVRYDRYDPDADATDPLGAKLVPLNRTFETVTFAAAALYPPARLIAEYDILRNALGRAADGSATTLKDDTFTLRAELAF